MKKGKDDSQDREVEGRGVVEVFLIFHWLVLFTVTCDLSPARRR